MEFLSFFNITQFAEAVFQDVGLIRQMVDEGYLQYAKMQEDGARVFSAKQAAEFPDVYEKYLQDHNIDDYSINEQSKSLSYSASSIDDGEPELVPEQSSALPESDSLISDRVMEDGDLNSRQLDEIQREMQAELEKEIQDAERIQKLRHRYNVEYKALIRRWSLEDKYKNEEDGAHDKRLSEEIKKKEEEDEVLRAEEIRLRDTNQDTDSIKNESYQKAYEANQGTYESDKATYGHSVYEGNQVSEYENQYKKEEEFKKEQEAKSELESRLNEQRTNLEQYNQKLDDIQNYESIGNKHLDYSGNNDHNESVTGNDYAESEQSQKSYTNPKADNNVDDNYRSANSTGSEEFNTPNSFNYNEQKYDSEKNYTQSPSPINVTNSTYGDTSQPIASGGYEEQHPEPKYQDAGSPSNEAYAKNDQSSKHEYDSGVNNEYKPSPEIKDESYKTGNDFSEHRNSHETSIDQSSSQTNDSYYSANKESASGHADTYDKPQQPEQKAYDTNPSYTNEQGQSQYQGSGSTGSHAENDYGGSKIDSEKSNTQSSSQANDSYYSANKESTPGHADTYNKPQQPEQKANDTNPSYTNDAKNEQPQNTYSNKQDAVDKSNNEQGSSQHQGSSSSGSPTDSSYSGQKYESKADATYPQTSNQNVVTADNPASNTNKDQSHAQNNGNDRKQEETHTEKSSNATGGTYDDKKPVSSPSQPEKTSANDNKPQPQPASGSNQHKPYDKTKPESAAVIGNGSNITGSDAPTSGMRLKKADPYYNNLLLKRDVEDTKSEIVVAAMIARPKTGSSIARTAPAVAKATLNEKTKEDIRLYHAAKNDKEVLRKNPTQTLSNGTIIKQVEFARKKDKIHFDGKLRHAVGKFAVRPIEAVKSSDAGEGAHKVKAFGANIAHAINVVSVRPMFYNQLGILAGKVKNSPSPFSVGDIEKVNDILKGRKIIADGHMGISFRYKNDLNMNLNMFNRYFTDRGFGNVSKLTTKQIKIALLNKNNLYNANDIHMLESLLKMRPALVALERLEKNKGALGKGAMNIAQKLFGSTDAFKGLNLTVRTIKSLARSLKYTKQTLIFMGKLAGKLGKKLYKAAKWVVRRTPAQKYVTYGKLYIQNTNPYRYAARAKTKIVNTRDNVQKRLNTRKINKAKKKDLKYQNSLKRKLKDKFYGSKFGAALSRLGNRFNNMFIFKVFRGFNFLKELLQKLIFKLIAAVGLFVLSLTLVTALLNVMNSVFSSIGSFFSGGGSSQQTTSDYKPEDSAAGKTIAMLDDKYDDWFNNTIAIEVARKTPSVNTSFGRINYHYSDSTGVEASIPINNTKEIISMATVYHGFEATEDELKDYAGKLWKDSHLVTYKETPIYYCSGCQQQLRSCDADCPIDCDGLHYDSYCPGHVDLEVYIQTITFNGPKTLYDVDSTGKNPDSSNKWDGWTALNKDTVKYLYDTDWYALYGVNLVGGSAGGFVISDVQINDIVTGLSGSNSTRDNIAKTALGAVGKIPYSTGGRSTKAGYSDSNNTSVSSLNAYGQPTNGLDDAGFVDWVYWTAIGNNLGQCNSQYMIYYGSYSTAWSNIKTGDILWKGYYDNQGVWHGHVGIYINPTTIVHSTGAPINQVIIDSFNQSSWNGYISVTN